MGQRPNAQGGAAIWRQKRDEARAAARPATALRLDSPVSELPKASAVHVRLLRGLGLHTVRDLLLNLPYELESYGGPTPIADLPIGAQATAVVTVESVRVKGSFGKGSFGKSSFGKSSFGKSSFGKSSFGKSRALTEATVSDEDGTRMRVVWFNQPYLAGRLQPGDRLSIAGMVRMTRFGLEMQARHHEVLEDGDGPHRVGGLMPKYHLAGKLKHRQLADWVKDALPLADGLEDELPEPTRQRLRLLPLAEAVRRGHQPESEAEWREARRRMEHAELLELQAAFLIARRRLTVEHALPIPYRQDVIDAFKAGLGFELTHAQRRSTWEILKDLQQEVPMNRLLNGDVGAGKTAVAAAAAAMAHAAGLQTVVMAPTEILARQHLGKFRAYLEASFPGLTVDLLVSGLPAAERRRVRTAAASGHTALLVGTHALIEDEVELPRLGLAVVDEQHRFGTRQRGLLREKSRDGRPHLLAMTATPIPRTLALALYGEMALSVIDELPPGRTPVETQVVEPDGREDAYALVRREVRAGRQAFVICPLIEQSETVEAKAATVEFERLRTTVFPDLRLALVHGKLKDKDSAMRGFRAGESQVLVATSVVEVGVDVPNATVMMIEGADRFGLAQLHQLRGRVGRGSERSHCLLLADEPSHAALARLRLVAGTTDGFRLAEEDMRLRGMGELLGSRQHGALDGAMRALRTPELLSEIRQEAETLAAEDPDLTRWPSLWRAAEHRLDRTSIS